MSKYEETFATLDDFFVKVDNEGGIAEMLDWGGSDYFPTGSSRGRSSRSRGIAPHRRLDGRT